MASNLFNVPGLYFGTFYLKMLNIQIRNKRKTEIFPIAKITPPRVKRKKTISKKMEKQ